MPPHSPLLSNPWLQDALLSPKTSPILLYDESSHMQTAAGIPNEEA